MVGLQKFHCSETKIPHLAGFLIKKDRSVVDDWPWKRKELTFLLGPGEWLLSSGGSKSLKKIMYQLQMSKSTLLRLLHNAKENPYIPVKPGKRELA